MKMRFVILAALMLSGTAFADPKADRAWRAKCAGCHGDDGKGATDQGKKMGIADMTAGAWQKQFTDDQIKATIASGFKRDKNGKHQEMEAFGTALRPDQIDGLIALVRGLAK